MESKPTEGEQPAPESRGKDQKPKRNPKSGRCFKCGEQGHKQAECKLKVHRIEAISSKRLHNSLRPGKVGERKMSDILLDSGAEVSLVRKGVLPRDWKQTGEIVFAGASGHILRKPKTNVRVDMGTRNFELECGVVEDPLISVPLLIGENVPSVSLLQLMLETAPDNQLNWDDMLERRKKREQSQADRTDRKAPTTEPRASPGAGTNNTPQPAIAPEGEAQQKPDQHKDDQEPQEREDPAQVNRLQLVQVMTRAQSRKEKLTEEANDKATEGSGAQISSWEELVPLEEENLPDQMGEDLDTVTPSHPRDRRQMKRAQQADQTLRDLWDRAGEEESPYMVHKGLLYKKTVD